MRPEDPKSTSAIALSPSPEVATTVPMPNVVCSTLSPAARDGIWRTVGPGAVADVLRHVWVAVAEVFRQLVTAASVRRQSTSWLGTSFRNRLGGLCWGEPQDDRAIARDVEPLAGSSDTDVREAPFLRQLAPSALRNRSLMRKTPSSQPVRKTVSNSRPSQCAGSSR